jgi:hypothetical protein
VYCFVLDPALGISTTDIVVQVTPEWGTSSGSDLFAYWRQGSFGCPANTVEVQTFRFSISSGNVTDVVASSSVGFSVTVWETPGMSAISTTASSPTGLQTNNP